MITFIIPWKRSYDDFAKHCLDSVLAINHDEPFEVIMVGPEQRESVPPVVWLLEPEGTNGAVKAINHAVRFAQMSTIVLLNEEFTIDESYKEAVANLYMNRLKITGLRPAGWKQHGVSMLDDRCEMISFPVMDKGAIDNYLEGYLFSPHFNHYESDKWLCYYMRHRWGLTVETTDGAWITPQSEPKSIRTDIDNGARKFERLKSKLGLLPTMKYTQCP